MSKKSLKAIWDRQADGWYFEVKDGHRFESGLAPGQGSLDDPGISDAKLKSEAKKFAKWCGINASKIDFEIEE